VDPADLDAVELLAAFRAHELCRVEATAAVLARIAKLDPRVNAKPRRRTASSAYGAARVIGSPPEPCLLAEADEVGRWAPRAR
jgi:Asp-tRNA(Asn)/Glu-tRNA(Gln) amidotransferase A subunit family amidase